MALSWFSNLVKGEPISRLRVDGIDFLLDLIRPSLPYDEVQDLEWRPLQPTPLPADALSHSSESSALYLRVYGDPRPRLWLVHLAEKPTDKDPLFQLLPINVSLRRLQHVSLSMCQRLRLEPYHHHSDFLVRPCDNEHLGAPLGYVPPPSRSHPAGPVETLPEVDMLVRRHTL